VSLHSAFRLLRRSGATETPRAEATPERPERSEPPSDDRVGPSVRPRSEPSSPLPSAEDPEEIRWAKLRAMRRGEGMGAVIWDASRPRNHDNGETQAIVRDSFSPWRR
jgi:hypothetical protein